MKIQITSLKRKFIGDFFTFCIITIGFHFFFRYWASHLEYWPIKNTILDVYTVLSKIVFEQSAWMVQLLLGDKVSVGEQQFNFINNGYISIGSGCSGLKQMLQLGVLFLFIKGYLWKKLWYIPLGFFAMHMTNLFRIISLSIIVIYKTEYWQLSHDYIFRPLFYVVIFIFWLVWIEKISP